MNKLKQLLKDERGVTNIEYGLIAVLISIVIITGTQYIGTNTANSLNKVSTAFTTHR